MNALRGLAAGVHAHVLSDLLCRAQFVHVLLGPAVVALGWPLWQRRAELRSRGGALVLAAMLGGATAGGSAVALAWAFGMPGDVVRSLASKSVTAPVAMGIAERRLLLLQLGKLGARRPQSDATRSRREARQRSGVNPYWHRRRDPLPIVLTYWHPRVLS